MKIAIGADHGGFSLKEKLKKYLEDNGHEVLDFGTFNQDSCDYPVFALRVAEAVSGEKAKRGVLVCTSGHGMAITANKVNGIRAVVCYDPESARMSRAHNDSNIIVFGRKFISDDKAEETLGAWLEAEFEGGRHARRVGLIEEYEKRNRG